MAWLSAVVRWKDDLTRALYLHVVVALTDASTLIFYLVMAPFLAAGSKVYHSVSTTGKLQQLRYLVKGALR